MENTAPLLPVRAPPEATPHGPGRRGTRTRRPSLRFQAAAAPPPKKKTRYGLRVKPQQLKKLKSSRYVGVCWSKGDRKWQARITVGGVQQHLGYFHDEAEGARAYDAAVVERNLHRPMNFPSGTGAEQAKKTVKMAGPPLQAAPKKKTPDGLDIIATRSDPRVCEIHVEQNRLPTQGSVAAAQLAILALHRLKGASKRSVRKMAGRRGVLPPP